MAAIKFIHIAKKESFTAEKQTQHTNDIVFIKDSQEIWTHGQYYAIPEEYKNKITNLETAVKALQSTTGTYKFFSKVSDGTNTAEAPGAASTITFTGAGGTTVAVGTSGVTITSKEVTESTTNGNIKWGTTEIPVHGLGAAAYKAEDYYATSTDLNSVKSTADKATEDVAALQTQAEGFDTRITTAQETAEAAKTAAATAQSAAENAQSTADAKVASVTGADAITVTTGTAPKVSLNLDNTGNVTLSQGTAGLKASVTIPSATVTGVKEDDKVLALTGTELSTTIAFSVDATADDAGKKYLRLTGIDGADLGKVDIADFVKDGMLDDASFDENSHKLTLTFNTASGKDAIEVDLSKLVDVYDGGNLKLTTIPIVETYEDPKAQDNVNTAIAKLIKGKKDLDTKVSNLTTGTYVNSFGGKTGAITLKAADKTTNGTVNLEMSDNELQASIVGLGSAAYTESTAYATSAQGGKADSALQSIAKGTDGEYVTTTIGDKDNNKQTVSVSLTVGSVADGTTGLATASDVKSYVDNSLTWIEY